LLKIPEVDMRKIRGKEISIIFQDPSTSLNPLFTVGRQLSDVFKTHFSIKEKEELKKMAIEALKDVALPDPERVYDMYPHELSGGMQQRAVIAIALSTKPKLLIADEPTTMLDVSIQAQILDLILELKKKLNLSILFITHNFGITAEICDRLAIMYAGTIVEEGYVEQVFESPLHPYTCGLLEAVPKITKEKTSLMHIPGSVPSLINPPTGCRFHPRCPYMMSECKAKPPTVIEIEHGHRVACYRSAKR
jgi:peptide/nickel transport system ATP-binding protein